jgi:hypothetical protein
VSDHRFPLFRLLAAGRRWLMAALAASVALVLVPLGQPAANAVTAVSPTTAPFGPANTLIPQWYADSTGVKLQPCNAGLPRCPFAPSAFVPPNGEAFYFLAKATLDTVPPAGFAAVRSEVVLGLEATFVPPPLSLFQRVRIRVQVPQPGTYTVTYPYGTKTFAVAAVGPRFEINDTVDTGSLGLQPANFALAAPAGGGSIEPFLKPGPGVVAPAGFLGDGLVHPVSGSPLGTNFFRVQGPGINLGTDPTVACPGALAGPNCIQQSDFLLQGQLLTQSLVASPAAVSVPNQTPGTKSAPQVVTVKNTGTAPVRVTTSVSGPQAGQFAARPSGTSPCAGATATLAAGTGSCTVSVTWAAPATAATTSSAALVVGG